MRESTQNFGDKNSPDGRDMRFLITAIGTVECANTTNIILFGFFRIDALDSAGAGSGGLGGNSFLLLHIILCFALLWPVNINACI